MNKAAALTLFALALASSPALALNKCVDADGAVQFSDLPCPVAAKASRFDVRPFNGSRDSQSAADVTGPTETAQPAGQSRLAAMKKYLADTEDARRVRELEAGIRNQEHKIANLKLSQEREVAGLRHQIAYTNNNLAGAMRANAYSSEMQAAATRYQTLVDTEQRTLDQMRRDLDSLRSKRP